MVKIKNLCEIIRDLTGIKPSNGTVYNMLHSAAMKAKAVVDVFPPELPKNPVVHCDENSLRVNGNLHWVHVISTSVLTYYAMSEKGATQNPIRKAQSGKTRKNPRPD